MANPENNSEITVPTYYRCRRFGLLVKYTVCPFCTDVCMSITVTSIAMAIFTLVDDKCDVLQLASCTLDSKNIELTTDWNLLN